MATQLETKPGSSTARPNGQTADGAEAVDAVRRTVGQDLRISFYKAFPYLIVVLGLGLVAIFGLMAVTKSHQSSKATTAAAPAGGSAAAAAAATVNVSLSEFAITPQMINVQADQPTTLHITNSGQAPHGLSVKTPDGVVQVASIDPGGTADLKLPALPAGNYDAWCPVPGHKEAGMTGMIMAGEGAATGSAGSTQTTQLGDGMSAQQMATMHAKSMKAFPAKTKGLGGQVLAPQVVGGVKVFHLSAKEIQWEVSPGQFQTALAYNGQVPGPEIRVHKGDPVKIVLTNDSPLPTTIHFHGLTVPNSMDGVPYVTQDPVMPGQTFIYQFKVVNNPGLYMYHSHFDSAEEVGRGMYGAFVVEPTHPTWNEEYTMILNDGPLGYTIDGKGWPATAPLTAHLGDHVLIRLSNMGSMLHPMHLHGFHFTVLDQDGAPLQHPYSADTLVVAPGETFDVMVVADQPGVWAFHCHILSHVEGPQGMFGMATALVVTK